MDGVKPKWDMKKCRHGILKHPETQVCAKCLEEGLVEPIAMEDDEETGT